ncbi:MBL fold metallo-hydrolase [Mesorhizobium sp. M0217]|uniref:MBL fold metallo-hydrolase n=1 Tax=unclassified Mesorhizobium TaxID=325217 RepID=UPI00333A878A
MSGENRLSALLKAWVLILICAVSFSAIEARADPVQRMRLPVGNYFISTTGWSGGGANFPPGTSTLLESDEGDGFALPAFCIDHDRSPPDASMGGFAGNVRVKRFKDGVEVKEQSLEEATKPGADQWLTISGVGLADQLAVEPMDDGFDYMIVVNGLAIAGETQQDTDSALKAWQAKPALMAVSSAFDAVRSVLAKGSNVSSSSELLLSLEEARQRFEWKSFPAGIDSSSAAGSDIDPADAREAADFVVEKSIRALTGADVAISENDRADWLLWYSQLAGLDPYDRGALADAFKALGSKVEQDTMSASDEALFKSLADVYRLDRQTASAASLRAALTNDDVSDDVTTRNSAYRIGGSVDQFFRTRRAGVMTQGEAVRAAAFARFDQRDKISGHVEFDLLDDLSCATDLDKNPIEQSLEESAFAKFRDLSAIQSMLGMQVASLADKFAKLSVGDDDKICIEWVEPDGSISRRLISRAELSPSLGKEFSSFNMIVDSPLDPDVDDDLLKVFSNVLTLEQARLKAARNAVNAPDTVGFSGPEFVVQTPSLNGHQKATAQPELSVMELQGRGDASYIKLIDGSIILVDTGESDDLVEKVRALIGSGSAAPKKIRLIITHSDLDHIGGLESLIDAKIPIDEIIIGLSAKDDIIPANDLIKAPAGLDLLNSLRKTLLGLNFEETHNNGVLHLLSSGAERAWIDADRPSRSTDWIDTFDFAPDADTMVSIHHTRMAKRTNDGGLIVRVSTRNQAWLLTDDMTPTTMRRLLASIPGELSAGVIKWPHHLWLPRENTSDWRTLRRFLQTVGAFAYLLSNVGHPSHDEARFEAIKGMIDATMMQGLIAAWTDKPAANLVVR